MFSVLPAFAPIRILGARSDSFAHLDQVVSPVPAEPQAVRFAPHWMLLVGLIVIALTIVSLAIQAIRGLF